MHAQLQSATCAADGRLGRTAYAVDETLLLSWRRSVTCCAQTGAQCQPPVSMQAGIKLVVACNLDLLLNPASIRAHIQAAVHVHMPDSCKLTSANTFVAFPIYIYIWILAAQASVA